MNGSTTLINTHVLRGAPRSSKDRVGGTSKRINERLSEVLVRECVEHRVDGAVGVAEDREALEHIYAPAENAENFF